LSTVKTQAVRNISYTAASQVIVLTLTLLMVTILARILTPEDFGIVSIGMLFMALFASFQDFGVTSAVIQRDTRIEDSISVGLSLRWIVAGVSFVTIIGLSPMISNFYDEPAIMPVIIVMSSNLIIQPIAFSSYVLLIRKLDFSKLAIASVVQCMATTVVSIGLVLLNFSYWSIVLGSLTGSVSLVLVMRYYERTSYRPRIDKNLMKELLEFGVHLLINATMAFIFFSVDQMVVGKVLGVVTLGVYFVSIRFGRTLGEQISGAVGRVLFPTMARMKDSMELLKVGYVQSLRMIAIIVVPLSLSLSALSPLLVSVVLGERWVAASVPIAILSFQGLLHAFASPVWNVLISIGKPKYLSIMTSIQAAALVVAIYPVARLFGVNGVCVLTTSTSVVALVYYVVVLSHIFKEGFIEIIRPIAPPLLSGLVIYAVLVLSVIFVPTNAFWLVTLSLSGAALYIVVLHFSSKGRDVRDLLSLLKKSFLDRQTI
jgi:O-antigen/teichoic acid export membrane protein